MYAWRTSYNQMEPVLREVYPERSKYQWRRLGVASSCDQRMPDFEMPGGWTPPEVGPGAVGPTGSGGGEEGEIITGDLPALTTATPFGSIQQPAPNRFGPLTYKQWLMVGAGVAVFYYYKRKK